MRKIVDNIDIVAPLLFAIVFVALCCLFPSWMSAAILGGA